MLKPLTPSKRRILRLLRDGKPIDPARDWVDLTQLVHDGFVETRNAPNGQLEVIGLTLAGRLAEGLTPAGTKAACARRRAPSTPR